MATAGPAGTYARNGLDPQYKEPTAHERTMFCVMMLGRRNDGAGGLMVEDGTVLRGV